MYSTVIGVAWRWKVYFRWQKLATLDDDNNLHRFFYFANPLRPKVPKRSQFSDEVAKADYHQLFLHDGRLHFKHSAVQQAGVRNKFIHFLVWYGYNSYSCFLLWHFECILLADVAHLQSFPSLLDLPWRLNEGSWAWVCKFNGINIDSRKEYQTQVWTNICNGVFAWRSADSWYNSWTTRYAKSQQRKCSNIL